MKKTVFALILSIGLSSCGQNIPPTSTMPNTKTQELINIPGTRLFIIPPDSFSISSNFIGLSSSNNSAIQIFDIVGGNYFAKADSLNKSNYERKGIKVNEFKNTTINRFSAKYVVMQGNSGTEIINLIFGDSSFWTMLTAIYLSTDSVTCKNIQKSLETIYYDKKFVINPLNTAPFTLADSTSTFKFAKYISGMYIYTKGGVYSDNFYENPFVIVSIVPLDSALDLKNISDLLIASLERNGLTQKNINGEKRKENNGHEVFETELNGRIKGRQSSIYQMIINDYGKAIVFQAIVKSDFESNLNEIKELLQTVKLKSNYH
jgi:hypothetical protein